MWHQGTIKPKVDFVIVLSNLHPHVLDTRVKSRAGVGSLGGFHFSATFTLPLLELGPHFHQ